MKKSKNPIVAIGEKIIPGFHRVTGWVKTHKKTIVLTAGGVAALYWLYLSRKSGYEKAVKELHADQQKTMAELKKTTNMMFKPQLDAEAMMMTTKESSVALAKQTAALNKRALNVDEAVRNPEFREWLKQTKGIEIKKVRK